MYAGHLPEAVSDAKQSVALAPQSPASAIALGWAYIESGTPSSGLRECDRALRIQESDRAFRCRAVAQLQLRLLAEALADANHAQALNSKAANNQIVLGRIELAQGDPTKALARFEAALELHPLNRAELYMYRGDAERASGALAKARLDFLEAKTLDTGLYRQALDQRLSALPAQ